METRPLREIAEEFRAWFAAQPKSRSEVAREANVDPSTVSRLVAGRDPSYMTEPLRKLCRMTGINLHGECVDDPSERLAEALQKLWDGSVPQGEAIATFLQATKALVDASSSPGNSK